MPASATSSARASAGSGWSANAVAYFTGIVAVLAACASSGFASVYFEKMLKQGDSSKAPSIWTRNLQLGVFGTLTSAAAMLINDGSAVLENGLTHNYDRYVWFILLNASFGGLLVAALIKYADNLVKAFGTSVSLVFAAVMSRYIFGTQLGALFCSGAFLVVVAVVLYSEPARAQKFLNQAFGLSEKAEEDWSARESRA